ncbi:MAG: hypothetical protein U9Q03_05570 [Patescibacteria group bacterium]|nr:hypothetical protein [Patescibacteria group bacterium]
MPAANKDNPFATIIKNHRIRVGCVFDKYRSKIATIRKERLDTMKKESASADEDQLAAIRKSLDDNR